MQTGLYIKSQYWSLPSLLVLARISISLEILVLSASTMLSSSFRRSKYASISSANQFRIKRKLERVKKKKKTTEKMNKNPKKLS